MTPDRLRAILGLVQWTGRGLASVLGCDERLIRRWMAGATEIPPAVAEWLEVLAAVHEANPPPETWRQRSRVSQGVPGFPA